MRIDYLLLGRQIQYCRKEQRMSQTELAERADLSVPYISHIETGRKKPSLETLMKIADVLSVTPDRLLYGNLQGHSRSDIGDFCDIFADCSPQEKQLLYQITYAVKQILRKQSI